MKKLLLATIATAALSLPVMAQNQPSDTQQNGQQQMDVSPQQSTGSGQGSQTGGQAADQQSQSQSGQNQQQAQNTIDPSQLSSHQIRQIQESLDKQGVKVGRADGKWGPSTERAVKDFQQKQHMQASGQLDQQTLQALGVNTSATTGQGSSEKFFSPSQKSAPNATSGSGRNGSPNNQIDQQ
jgi:peptidoglycan hydrolase-like protein with peptidoglycan-binding domain